MYKMLNNVFLISKKHNIIRFYLFEVLENLRFAAINIRYRYRLWWIQSIVKISTSQFFSAIKAKQPASHKTIHKEGVSNLLYELILAPDSLRAGATVSTHNVRGWRMHCNKGVCLGFILFNSTEIYSNAFMMQFIHVWLLSSVFLSYSSICFWVVLN